MKLYNDLYLFYTTICDIAIFYFCTNLFPEKSINPQNEILLYLLILNN